MKHSTSLTKLFVLTILLLSFNLSAQRPMDKLDRSVVAQKVSNGVYVNWRITSDEWYNTYYKLYRDGSLIFTTTTSGASNYLDPSGTISSKYTVSKVKNSIESDQSTQASVLTQSYLEIPMRDIKKLGKTLYYLNDATVADLDGDGQYEIIIKRMRRDWTAECVDFTYFEAYKLDGTFMWAIDVGPNITMDVEINIAAFDFDGDGKAEVFMRTSDDTVFGLDINNQGGTSVGDRDGDGYTNYRKAPFNGIGGDGFMNAGPEYLSLIDGMTGKELDWVNFIPRGQSSDWGDSYGHRANKFFFGAPYLDGKKPSLFIGRGIYTRTKMQTYDIVNKKFVPRWSWEVLAANQLQQGKYDDVPKNYFGQGYHNYAIADVDGDGCDEINWGSMTIDNDGKPLYSTELGHGDAQHYGDFDPYRKGLEMFACNEDNPGTNMRDAKTGQILYRHISTSDVGRCGAGNISDTSKGSEIWGAGVGLSATDRVEGQSFGVAESNCIYWDGDLLQEMCDHTGFSTSTGVGYGQITKFNGYGNVSSLLNASAYSCNYTKGTPCLQADIIGDWREEAIWWRTDSLALRIYTTPIQTTNRIYTLMQDAEYRQAICWQMCGYNQPPHTSFYLGSDFPTPIPAQSTNGKIVWTGTSSTWDASTANFMDGDDAAGLYAGTSSSIPFANGKSVLFDTHATNRTVDITGALSPEALTVSGIANYKIGGTGSLTGAMKLDKMGDSTLVLTGTHSYTGTTDVWEGDFWMNGTLSASPVMVRRHANFGGKGIYGNGISTEYNAGIYVGGKDIADTTTVNGDINLVEGAKLCFDLSGNPDGENNDLLVLNGTLKIEDDAIVVLYQTAGVLSPGSYLLGKITSVSGDISKMKIEGALGVATNLSYDSDTKSLYLVVTGVRDATTIVWTGKISTYWDLAKTANWSNNDFDDIFVANDSVLFNSTSTNRTVNLVDLLPVSNVEVNSNLNYSINGTGELTGAMELYKTNSGTLSINNRNSYTGKTVVDGGSLIMNYAPSQTNNGGIGLNDTNPANFIVKDSAMIQILTANEQTDRGLTLEGTSGGVLNVTSNLYWNGIITGTKLTKMNTGTLYIGNSNSTLNETVLNSGTILLNTDDAVKYGVGKKITLLGGTLETYNSTYSYLSSYNNFEVPKGYTATVVAGARCEYNGTLTGEGNLNWKCDYVRANINGNWSAFSGRLNIFANSANSTLDDVFIVNNSNGFPNATINLNSGITMCYKNGTSNNGTSKIKIGMLSGVAGSVFYNAALEVGASNANGIYAGVITGSSNVVKVGTGLWVLTGANTYTGTTTVSEGTMNVKGSLGTGTVTISNGGELDLDGTVGGSALISNGGTLNIAGTINGLVANSGTIEGTGTINGNSSLSNNSSTIPGANRIGTLTFGGNVSMTPSASIFVQVTGNSTTSDKLVVSGSLTCNGTLDVTIYSGSFVIGDTYQIIDAGSITGTFNTVNLPDPGQGIEWDLSELYTAGKIKLVQRTGIQTPQIISGVIKNPSTGIFRIYTNTPTSNLDVIVCNLEGKIVFHENVLKNAGLFEIDLTYQPSGIYLLKVNSEQEFSNVLKLIKQ
ncbi:MAG: autotransporter-associated beta strand repeat-containing protein [Paludibacter sp.]|nr:autotransporter-associated beta strand repeat-containing protein [Paludibacter sp.]